MKLNTRLHETLQSCSFEFKIGHSRLTIELDKNDDGTIDKESIEYKILHYPKVKIENPSKPGWIIDRPSSEAIEQMAKRLKNKI